MTAATITAAKVTATTTEQTAKEAIADEGIRTRDTQRDYARLLEKAHAEGVRVTAIVTSKSDPSRRYIVVAGSTGTDYLVQVGLRSLSCSCPAGQHDHLCKHRALAHQWLADQHDAQLVAATVAEVDANNARLAAAAARDARALASRDRAVRRDASLLARGQGNRAAFSVWK